MTSSLEAQLAWRITTAGITPPVVEFVFAKPRRWRFDFSWPEKMIAVEVEGGTWARGRHTRGEGFRGDCEKYNAAQLMGWAVYRFTADMITDGTALATIIEAMK